MLNPDFREVLSEFAAERVEFVVVGAFALAAHGLPRATDIDLWVRPDQENAQRVWRALARFGAPVTEITPDDFAVPEMVVQIGVPPSRIDVLTSIDGVGFAEAWEERASIFVDGVEIPVIGREHLIRNKTAAGRPQDLADLARLRALSGPRPAE